MHANDKGLQARGAETIDWEALREAAVEALGHAYVPYSKYPVGAAAIADDGRLVSGCNVENAAYPQGVCAEAAALSAMVLAGGRRATALLVVGEGPPWVTPCGGCRQKLREFAAPDTPVLVADAQGIRQGFTLAQLLPHAFGPEHLGPA